MSNWSHGRNATAIEEYVKLLAKILFYGAAVLLIVVFCLPHKPAPRYDLDMAQPIYTARNATVCPESAVERIDGPERLKELFTATLSRREKERELGCVELSGGIPVGLVSDPQGALLGVVVRGQMVVTTQFELTNDPSGKR